MTREHRLEIRSHMLATRMDRMKINFVKWLKVQDRPAYSTKLNPFEMWQRWKNPKTHHEDAQRMMAQGGQPLLANYERAMMELDMKITQELSNA